MKRLRFKPTWRGRDREVDIVLYPTRAWFDAVQRPDGGNRVVRFALMEDGDLFFGDAYEVMHQDIQQVCGKAEKCWPILVGSLVYLEGVWRIGSIQYTSAITSDHPHEIEIAKARLLLPRLSNWLDMVWQLSCDPMKIPSCEEYARGILSVNTEAKS